jgi:hypothetical protein
MRTTLDIDEDVLESIKKLAVLQGSSAGRVVSELVRVALAHKRRSFAKRHGVPVLPKRKGAGPVTMEIVNRLRDEP